MIHRIARAAGIACVLFAAPHARAQAPSAAALLERIEALEERVARLEGGAPVAPARKPTSLRERFEARMAQDRAAYTPEQLREIESLYQIANKEWSSAPARASLEKLTSTYAKANRTGCALLYLGQMAAGDDKERYLKQAIDHGDCWYGDGVQVGAYARFHLAMHYQRDGKRNKAQELFDEVRRDFPDAIDHKGNLLANIMPR